MGKTLFAVSTIVLCLSINVNAQTATPPPGGNGTEANPYLITSLDNLYWLTQSDTAWHRHYQQTTDIDASSTSGWDSGSGFTPIGNNTTKFTGSYDGSEYSISDLYIDRSSTSNVGLFGYTDGADIEDLSLVDVDITGDDYVGALVGYNTNSDITNTSSTGTVTGSTNVGGLIGIDGSSGHLITTSYTEASVTGANFVGGFIGQAGGTNISHSHARGEVSSSSLAGGFLGYGNSIGTFSDCYATGNVTTSGNSAYIGGLVGSLNGGDITRCYATGDVNGGGSTGGLLGRMSSSTSISETYATGSVTGTSTTGGLVGNYFSGTISDSYATGVVSGGSQQGGLIGGGTGSSLSNSYWNTETSGQATSVAGTGRTTAEMKQDTSYSGWDFDDTWAMYNGSVLPYLRGTTHRVGGPEITGSEGWHMLASPFMSSTFATLTDSIWTQGFTGASTTSGDVSLYTWTESAQNWTTPTSLGDTLDIGEGFIAYVYDDDDPSTSGTQGGFPKSILASGKVHTLPIEISTPKNFGGSSGLQGMNLVANPTTSSIDWEEKTSTNISTTYYVWDTANGHYDTYQEGGATTNGGQRYIAPFQSFFVQAATTGASITIDSAATDTMDATFYKSSADQLSSVVLHLENEEERSDEFRFVMRENSDPLLDEMDALALSGIGDEFIALSSKVGEEHLIIDSRPIASQIEIELLIDIRSTSGNATLSLTENTLPEELFVELWNTNTDQRYDLKVQDVDLLLGSNSKHEEWKLVISSTATVSNEEDSNLPDVFALKQNYPNPFNPSTIISYQLPEAAKVELRVYDLLGREVAILVNERVQAGYHEVNFEAGNLSSGMYIYRLKAENQVFTKKLTLIK